MRPSAATATETPKPADTGEASATPTAAESDTGQHPATDTGQQPDTGSDQNPESAPSDAAPVPQPDQPNRSDAGGQ